MELVKETDTYKIYKKRNGRYGVKNASGKWVNADEKVKILSEEGLIKAKVAAKPEPEEAPAEEAATEAEATEEAPAEEAPAAEA